MNRLVKNIVAAFAAVALPIVANAAELPATCKVYDLRCENQTNPMGVDETKPRLSWKLADARRGARQTAYRVLCASSAETLAKDQGDLWDSGKVASGQSHLVEYGGKTLESGQIVHWKVKVWDPNDAESPWSEPSRWEMGLLQSADWKAKWIQCEDPVVNNEHTERAIDFLLIPEDKPAAALEKAKDHLRKSKAEVVFAKDFVLDEVPDAARLYVSAFGFQTTYLNGIRVGDAEWDPPFSHGYSDSSFYAAYDVTGLLRPGNNTLRCFVKTRGGYMWNSFILQIDAVKSGSRSTVVATDGSWKWTISPAMKLFSHYVHQHGGVYDARITPGRPASSGEWGQVKTGGGRKLIRRYLPPERIVRRVSPVAVFSPAPGVHTFDLGEIISGEIEWQVPADLKEGDVVVFRYGMELLTHNGRPNIFASRPLSYPKEMGITVAEGALLLGHYNSQIFPIEGVRNVRTDYYIARSGGTGTCRMNLANTPFRYVEVIGLKTAPKKDDLTGLMIHSDVERVGSFACSEPAFERLHRICAETFLMNSHGNLTDCWDRERSQWNGEWPKSQFMRYVYDIDPLLRKHTLDNGLMIRRHGRCGSTASHLEFEEPTWPGNLVYLPRETIRFGGDFRTASESFDEFLVHLRHYARQLNQDDLLDQEGVFGDWLNYPHHAARDWVAGQPESIRKAFHVALWPLQVKSIAERQLLLNSATCDMAGICARWAGQLGRLDEQKELASLHQRMKAALHRRYYNADAGSYGVHPIVMPGGEDTLDAWAIHTGIVPEEERARVVRGMVKRLRERDHRMTTGIITTLAFLRALADFGYADDAFAAMNRDGPIGARHILSLSSDGLAEAIHLDRSSNIGSIVHGDFAQIADWFWYGLGGLRPDEDHPGLKHFTLAPQIPSKMRWARIAHESPYGKIVSSWKRDGDLVRWEATVPPNSAATALIPTSDAATIREAGKSLAEAGLAAQPGPHGTTRCELPAGSYRFEFQAVNQSSNPL